MTESSAARAYEDAKLFRLARFTRGRTGAAESAAVSDLDGRTYAAVSIELPSLRLSALQVCVAMAVSSGARGLEACVLVAEGDEVAKDDLAALRDLGGNGVPVFRYSAAGTLTATLNT
jgi:hypothetical protein